MTKRELTVQALLEDPVQGPLVRRAMTIARRKPRTWIQCGKPVLKIEFHPFRFPPLAVSMPESRRGEELAVQWNQDQERYEVKLAVPHPHPSLFGRIRSWIPQFVVSRTDA